jgi:outer membrane protein assembly factor BamB
MNILRAFPLSCRSLRAMLWLAALCLFALRGPTIPADGGDVARDSAEIVAGDWPMAAHDARRSASALAELPRELRLRWELHLPALKPAWPDQPRLPGERVYCPIIMSGRLILASPTDDSVAAYDMTSGREIWRIFTGGPVRCPPAGWKDRVFVGSDDGFLYAIGVADGAILWKFKGVPKNRLALGNGRMVDTWPVRGGPVVAAGAGARPVVYFAAGLWPFMGIFLQCLDAQTGSVIWTNSGDGPAYQIQPHNSPSFAGIAPQGPMAVSGDRLLIPNGRAVPACYDRFTGKLRYFQLPTRAGGDHVVLGEHAFYNDGIAFDLKDGKPTAMFEKITSAPAIDGQTAYATTPTGICAFDLANPADRIVSKILGGPRKRFLRSGEAESAGLEVVIRTGGRIYAGGKDKIVALDLPMTIGGSAPAWQADVNGIVGDLAAGAGCLVAVTEEGGVYCFGGADAPGAAPYVPLVHVAAGAVPTTLPAGEARVVGQAAAILADARRDAGWALGLGAPSLPLVREIVRQSRLECVIVEPSPDAADQLRRELAREGLYGVRVSVLVGDIGAIPLPAYFANVIVGIPRAPAPGSGDDTSSIAAIYRALHPYRGRAYLAADAAPGSAIARWALAADPAHTAVAPFSGMIRLSRFGGIDGAGNWTHEHADESNTRVSRDSVVKAPLGILWWGGSTNVGILPRHGHGPQPQVLDGRIVVEGVDMMRSIDIYTGRVLWDIPLPGVGSFYNSTAHQAGANGVGSNFVSTHDGIYVALAKSCVQLDPVTGRTLRTFPLSSDPGSGPDACWSYINVSGDYLIAGAAPPAKAGKLITTNPIGKDLDDAAGEDPKLTPVRTITNPRTVGSHKLFVMDRKTGKTLWSVQARSEFRHNAICIGSGRLYAIDRPQGKDKFSSFLYTPGQTQPSSQPALITRLTAFELSTGKIIWKSENNVFGTWLSFSQEHDVLMEAGRLARDTLKDEPKGMRAYRASTGEILWADAKATGPAMIRGQTVLKESSAADLLTGAPVTREDPLTGEEIDWAWTRMYGCNTPAASQNLLTFRSGAAGYYDLARLSGTGNFGGFRSSCTNNLIVAGGVLCAPDYTRTCTCSYQIQSSVALIPDAEVEMWTFMGNTIASKSRIRRVGINLGAPGDRLADNGTLWLEHPNSGGPDPQVKVDTYPANTEFFRRHSMLVSGPLPWVASSGARGLRRIRVTLNGDHEFPRHYTVRLCFCQPPGPPAGNSVMDVAVQGEEVEQNFDIVKTAGGYDRSIIREYQGVRATDEITVELTPKTAGGATILCGVEIVEEGSAGH